MDSWRDTTLPAEDEDDYSSEGSMAVHSAFPSCKTKSRRRIISSDDSEDDIEYADGTKMLEEEIHTSSAKTSEVAEVEEENVTNGSLHQSNDESFEASYSESAEEEDENEFESDFLHSKKFNSTFAEDNFHSLKRFSIAPEEPIEEEEEALMKSICEQLSTEDLTSNSIRSSTGRTSNIRRELSADIINATDDSVQIVETEISVEEILSSDEDSPQKLQNTPFKTFARANTTIRQPTLPEMLKKEPSLEKRDSVDSPISSAGKNEVTRVEYTQMKQNLEVLNYEKRKLEMAMRTIQVNQLPDKGKALHNKQNEMDARIKIAQDALANAVVESVQPPPLSWKGIEAGTTEVQPRTFGTQAMQTYNTEKSLTLDRLHNLHSSLKSCPTPETLADDPKGLKVELMLHQKHALAWLMWRELQKPAGGILADDMGLGKTLTMISLVTAHNQMREDDDESESDDENESEAEQRQYKYNGGTLVVCPASLLGQWVNEVKDKLEKRQLSVETYHGPKRETKAKRLAKYDMVVTTYAICQSEGESETPLYRIKWERIILDEAHQIRNHKSKTTLAVCRLGAKRRWALTGTPVHNKELDLYALLKFLRCSPFDDVTIFKRWISSKNGGGHQRLHTVLSSMLLRRTKEQLKTMEQLTCLPEREWQLVEIKMDKEEMEVYQKILLFSRTLFAQFLHQRAERNADSMEYQTNINNPSNEYYKMHKKLVQMNKVPTVKQSDILVLLLRLRQICCHPSLITAMLDNVADLGGDADGDLDVSMDLLDQLNKMNIDDEENDDTNDAENKPGNTGGADAGDQGVGLAEGARNLLNPSHPIFNKSRQSIKLKEVIKLLQEKVLPAGDKAIIVSQWTSLLHLLVPHLKELDIKYCHLDGTVAVKNRGEIVYNFNNPDSGVQVMLLSLTAGGVGLNLVGANHLVFLDLHWNPQLEMQAQDRIYRVGQRKKVFVYKLMTVETIEQRIKNLQDKKKEIAESLLQGSKMQQSKLSMDDLKMLFNM